MCNSFPSRSKDTTAHERCLVENGGNVAATAAELGISRSRLTQVVLSDAELRRLAGRDG